MLLQCVAAKKKTFSTCISQDINGDRMMLLIKIEHTEKREAKEKDDVGQTNGQRG